MAQLLFACPRARRDIYTAVYLLNVRVPDTDEGDLIKLNHLICMSGKLSICH